MSPANCKAVANVGGPGGYESHISSVVQIASRTSGMARPQSSGAPHVPGPRRSRWPSGFIPGYGRAPSSPALSASLKDTIIMMVIKQCPLMCA